MTEDLITDLSKVSGLFVIARNSSFAYKGKATKVQDIGRELGVKFMLEGSIRKAGNRVRITAQLVDTQTGGHLWADRFDRELTDIFATQDEVVQKIVAALAVKLTRREEQRLRHRGTSNIEAYDFWSRARELLGRGTREAVVQARAMPHITDVALLAIRFRYRPSAHSGKYLAYPCRRQCCDDVRNA